jgi:hypothetical protein
MVVQSTLLRYVRGVEFREVSNWLGLGRDASHLFGEAKSVLLTVTAGLYLCETELQKPG